MPTIKLSGGKVVMKSGKVSCSCCAPTPSDCCPYPADGFNTLWFDADLPATLNAIIDGSPVLLTKSVADPVYYTGTWDGHDVTLNSGWSLYIRGFGSGVEGDAAKFDFSCLITSTLSPDLDNPPEAPAVTAIRDEFPDSLSVDIPSLPVSGMVIDRLDVDVNPCDWYGCQFYEHVGDEDRFLVVTDHYNGATYKFELTVEIWSGSDCGALFEVLSTTTYEKDDPQDTPVGNFGGNTAS